ETIRDKYQYHTRADLAKLRAAGFGAPFLSIEEGVRRYVSEYLSKEATGPKPAALLPEGK
ncbi:MAG: hypothetical protein FWH25_02535, partial [Syntrophorhabdaceae bacterium]|nr:hypothetical protein [Syntrophorhabdaceae bacterium]